MTSSPAKTARDNSTRHRRFGIIQTTATNINDSSQSAFSNYMACTSPGQQTSKKRYSSTSPHHQASKAYLHEIDRQKLAPLPVGVLLTKLKYSGTSISGITRKPTKQQEYEGDKHVDLSRFNIGAKYGAALGKGLKYL